MTLIKIFVKLLMQIELIDIMVIAWPSLLSSDQAHITGSPIASVLLLHCANAAVSSQFNINIIVVTLIIVNFISCTLPNFVLFQATFQLCSS